MTTEANKKIKDQELEALKAKFLPSKTNYSHTTANSTSGLLLNHIEAAIAKDLPGWIISPNSLTKISDSHFDLSKTYSFRVKSGNTEKIADYANGKVMIISG